MYRPSARRRGKSATRSRKRTLSTSLFVANAHDTILCFSSLGKVYWLKVYELPQAGSRPGPADHQLLPLGEGERINAFLPVREYDEDKFVFMATTNGYREEDAPAGIFAAPVAGYHRPGPARG
jgi:DNA gyrase subunit A